AWRGCPPRGRPAKRTRPAPFQSPRLPWNSGAFAVFEARNKPFPPCPVANIVLPPIQPAETKQSPIGNKFFEHLGFILTPLSFLAHWASRPSTALPSAALPSAALRVSDRVSDRVFDKGEPRICRHELTCLKARRGRFERPSPGSK